MARFLFGAVWRAITLAFLEHRGRYERTQRGPLDGAPRERHDLAGHPGQQRLVLAAGGAQAG